MQVITLPNPRMYSIDLDKIGVGKSSTLQESMRDMVTITSILILYEKKQFSNVFEVSPIVRDKEFFKSAIR